MRVSRAGVWLASLALAGGVLGYFRTRPRTVEVVAPVRKMVVESIAASGRLRGRIETSVGAQTGGRLEAVLVREGDRVTAGQVLARLDSSVVGAQVAQARVAVATAATLLQQARDAVATAQAQVALASRPPLPEDIARLRADVAQNTAVARARLAASRQRLASAQRRLAEWKKGPRDEEIDAAEAQALQAQASFEQAERDRERQKALLAEGAVAPSVLDQAETGYWVARRALENARARLRQLRAGTRPEQVEQAQADMQAAAAEVRAAEATLAGAQASGNAQLRALLAQPRIEDVQVARRRLGEARQAQAVAQARLAEAREALDVARRRAGDAVVRAPFEGTIAQVVTEAGGVTGPNAPIVRLVRTAVPEIRIDLDEMNLGRVRVGQEAVVTSDAFAGQSFGARVHEIGAQVDADRGTLEVRLTPLGPPAWLRPGQTLSVNILVDKGTERLVVPLTAVNTIGGESSLLVVKEGKIARRTIRIGSPGPDGIPVVEGVSASDAVLVHPAGWAVGQVVQPVRAGSGKG